MWLARAGQSARQTVPVRKVSQQNRSIHITGRILPHVKPTSLAHRARTFITHFVTKLHVTPPTRSYRPSPSIRQSLSLPARIALSRPLRAPCLPRTPRIPGNVTQLGLGTARSFSTGRPIFQHLVENVPVAGRTFYEVDWDVKTRQEKAAVVRGRKESRRKPKSADKLKPVAERHAEIPNAATEGQNFDYYFSGPSFPLVTTYLQIPLAPTPTARVPLPLTPSPRLLPLPALAKEHASYSKHAIKVSSIFRRLDAARVWGNGVSCDVFGDPSGLCTVLTVKFEGWTEDMVREALGEAGKGWCTIQEIREDEKPLESTLGVLERLPASSVTSDGQDLSFVIPTIDVPASSSVSTALSENSPGFASLSDADTDYSDLSVWAEDNMSVSSRDTFNSVVDDWSSVSTSPRSQSWLGFSSEFSDRAASFIHE